ncbi:neurotrimin-like [Homarus americanus]|uniref:neurotrimin-like n=1 Tax=Homarus americanus TaxID=6706 RepID=UPI001C47CE2C|nr:neurotrimin-like [Homarus americanus]XP_042218247.1 neurotrimin-like [Homarus americanus]
MAGRACVLVVVFVLMASRLQKVRSEEVAEGGGGGGRGLPRFVGELHNVTVPLGRDTVLPCTVENLQNFKVAWVQVDTQTVLTIHNQMITRNPRISLLHNDGRTWHLYLSNVREKDRGWYMCQVNTDPMLNRQAYLDVVVPPDIIDRESSGDLTIREGEDVTLTCRARGHPTPGVLWRREDNQDIILDEDNTVREVEGDTLVMKKVSRLQMGSYLCIAHNGVPPSISKRTHLTVQFPPMVWVPQQLEGAYPNQELTIECHTEAFPKSINYWTNPNGDMIVAGSGYEPVVTEKSQYKVYMTLTIRHLRPQDFGGYRCVAKNSLGETDGAIRVYGRKMMENPTQTKGMNDLSKQLHREKSSEIEVTPAGHDNLENHQSGHAAVHHLGPVGRDSAARSSTTTTLMDHYCLVLLLVVAQLYL